MLTDIEKLLFIILGVLTLGATLVGFEEAWKVIQRGQGDLRWNNFIRRAINALVIYISQRTTLKTRRVTSLLHWGVVIGFTYFFLVNFVDMLYGFIPNFTWPNQNAFLPDLYRLFADLTSVAVIVGVAYFLLRRFLLPNKKELKYHSNVLLHPKVAAGAITADSLIVGVFILIHVGSRFLGSSVYIADHGADVFSPFATLVSPLFSGLGSESLLMLEHLFWWLALGGILLFTPYFPYTKHAHLFMAPFNFLTRPERTSLGEMEKLDFEDETKEQFGANKLEDLSKKHLVDAFACIMCNRCQDVCPAYITGKELSPSALEINKRYLIKDEMSAIAGGAASSHPLLGFAISQSAVWACTTCAACIEICPVGNEPMLDILDIRRDAVLMQGDFPAELQGAFKGMERQSNPWQNPEPRFAWAKGLDIPTVDENPDFDILFWTGCAVSYDPRAQITARALVKVLKRAGVNFAVLGERENCTGDVARRAGKEDTYQELAATNVETLNEFLGGEKKRRIVATCPHCLHNIGREYHQFGGEYEVIHHTELIDELIAANRLPESVRQKKTPNVTFHDPCYLGRHNDIVEAPRDVLKSYLNGGEVTEMPRHGKNSLCCGAGGAQFWKEEEHGSAQVNVVRYEEAKSTGAEVLAVGCPFCMQMFETAQAGDAKPMIIKDVVELIAEALPE
ncbi:MAG: (Fe-S)-binding protein [Anaerolineae bacterium]|nr:(Fe-S)-binding protein [Anaerolineae bacterium]